MKEIYKNPVFYYLFIPVIVALWPLLLWGVYLPGAKAGYIDEKKQYNEAEKRISEILLLAPDRLGLADSGDNETEFTYDKALAQARAFCGIPPNKYTLDSSSPGTGSGGQEIQTAKVNLYDVEIEQFARFITVLLRRWPSLQCTQIRLTNKADSRAATNLSADTWDVNLDFKYYF